MACLLAGPPLGGKLHQHGRAVTAFQRAYLVHRAPGAPGGRVGIAGGHDDRAVAPGRRPEPAGRVGHLAVGHGQLMRLVRVVEHEQPGISALVQPFPDQVGRAAFAPGELDPGFRYAEMVGHLSHAAVDPGLLDPPDLVPGLPRAVRDLERYSALSRAAKAREHVNPGARARADRAQDVVPAVQRAFFPAEGRGDGHMHRLLGRALRPFRPLGPRLAARHGEQRLAQHQVGVHVPVSRPDDRGVVPRHDPSSGNTPLAWCGGTMLSLVPP